MNLDGIMIGLKVQRWLRFIIGGGINTGFTYIVYLVLNKFLAYQVAYLIAYGLGIVFAYWFNSIVVFRVPLSWSKLLSYPMVYVIQYLVSAFLLGGIVEFFRVSEVIAPLVVVVAMIPVSYFMSKFVLK